MPDRRLQDLIRRLRQVVGPKGGILPDAELLRRFVELGDQAAFEALVWRHGPMILSVCRRILHHEQDAEDAFQATFLVLARMARSVRKKASIAAWLYRIAKRTSQRTGKQNASRQRTLGALAGAGSSGAVSSDVERLELQRLLDEEIRRLPGEYRETASLRYLEGHSTDETARLMGCPPGTVLSRLAWARERLRSRLAQRGLGFEAAIAMSRFSRHAVPASCVKSTVSAAMQVKTSSALGVSRATPFLIAEGVVHTMVVTKWTIGALAVAGVLTAAAGLHGLAVARSTPQATGAQPEQDVIAQKAPAPALNEPAPKAKEASPEDVRVMTPIEKESAEYVQFEGRTQASASIDIRPRFSSTLQNVLVRGGAEVKKGDLLFELDKRPFDIALDKTRAEVVRAESRYIEAKTRHAQTSQLAKSATVSAQEVQIAQSRLEVAKADLELAKVGLEGARLDAEAARITAPISGRIGEVLAVPGSSVDQKTLLTTLVSADPIYVNFYMDERSFMQLRTRLQAKSAMPVSMSLGNDAKFSRTGRVYSVDNQFNPVNGSIRVRAVFPNPMDDILPGMVARVRLNFGEPQKVLLLPSSLIDADRGSNWVYLVNDKDELERRFITLGWRDGSLLVVHKGIQRTDRVVLGFPSKTKLGSRVKPVSVPASALTPAP